MTYSPQEMIELLAQEYPPLRALLEEHLEDNDGELLGHVLFGDIVRWVESLSPSDPEVRQLISDLDQYHLEGDADVQNMIGVSFIEALPYQSDFLGLLGPALSSTEMARRQRGD